MSRAAAGGQRVEHDPQAVQALQAQPVAFKARCGYLPGELALQDNTTVEGLLRYLDSLRGRRVDWACGRQMAGRLDLDLKRPLKNLSWGNKQKMGVVQALVHRPELLLLDEPTIGPDPLMQQEMLDLLRLRARPQNMV